MKELKRLKRLFTECYLTAGVLLLLSITYINNEKAQTAETIKTSAGAERAVFTKVQTTKNRDIIPNLQSEK